MRGWTFFAMMGLMLGPALLLGGPLQTGPSSVVRIQPPPATSPTSRPSGLSSPDGAGTSRVSGETSASAPAPPLTESDAKFALRSMVLAHHDPYIRQAGYLPKDTDWSIDVANKTFTVMVQEPEPRQLAGTFYVNTGRWYAKFTDDEKLTAPWMPPGDATLSLAEARAALAAMCALPDQPDVKGLGGSFDTATVDNSDASRPVLRSAYAHVVWTIDLKQKTFSVSDVLADYGHVWDGVFGWDKDKHWAAWPRYARTVGGVRGR